MGDVRAALEAAFSGDEFEENADAAAQEGEWSWFRWLAVSTLDAATSPAVVPDDDAAGASRERVAAYMAERDGFFGDEALDDDVLDTADGSSQSAPLLLSDLRTLAAARPADPDRDGEA